MKHLLQTEWSQHRCTCGVKLQSQMAYLDHLVECLDEAEQALIELKVPQ